MPNVANKSQMNKQNRLIVHFKRHILLQIGAVPTQEAPPKADALVHWYSDGLPVYPLAHFTIQQEPTLVLAHALVSTELGTAQGSNKRGNTILSGF